MLSFEKFNINRFWEKTPNSLKYILIFAIFLIVGYFIQAKRMEDIHLTEISSMKIGINATYELIDNFEEFRDKQDIYNKEVLEYLHNLHSLVEDLNNTTNRKLDMILKSGDKNSVDLLEKILLLNESFEKLSKAYQKKVVAPNIGNNIIKSNEYSVNRSNENIKPKE